MKVTGQRAHLKSMVTPIKVWSKEHLTKSPSIWDKKWCLFAALWEALVIWSCRLVWPGLQWRLPCSPTPYSPHSSKLFHAFAKICQGHMLFLPWEGEGWSSFPTLHLVTTPPSPLGLSSKISFFGKLSPLLQAGLVTSLSSVEACVMDLTLWFCRRGQSHPIQHPDGAGAFLDFQMTPPGLAGIQEWWQWRRNKGKPSWEAITWIILFHF